LLDLKSGLLSGVTGGVATGNQTTHHAIVPLKTEAFPLLRCPAETAPHFNDGNILPS
jgi:hypothetical protein